MLQCDQWNQLKYGEKRLLPKQLLYDIKQCNLLKRKCMHCIYLLDITMSRKLSGISFTSLESIYRDGTLERTTSIVNDPLSPLFKMNKIKILLYSASHQTPSRVMLLFNNNFQLFWKCPPLNCLPTRVSFMFLCFTMV